MSKVQRNYKTCFIFFAADRLNIFIPDSKNKRPLGELFFYLTVTPTHQNNFETSLRTKRSIVRRLILIKYAFSRMGGIPVQGWGQLGGNKKDKIHTAKAYMFIAFKC